MTDYKYTVITFLILMLSIVALETFNIDTPSVSTSSSDCGSEGYSEADKDTINQILEDLEYESIQSELLQYEI